VIIQFSRRSFSGFGAQSHSKLLNQAQAEALDAIHFLAEKFHVAMELKKGDIQLINNMSILHSRRSYLDDTEHK
jgi:alpha-ketoglutarate-dependent taurine dioxygenase